MEVKTKSGSTLIPPSGHIRVFYIPLACVALKTPDFLLLVAFRHGTIRTLFFPWHPVGFCPQNPLRVCVLVQTLCYERVSFVHNPSNGSNFRALIPISFYAQHWLDISFGHPCRITFPKLLSTWVILCYLFELVKFHFRHG